MNDYQNYAAGKAEHEAAELARREQAAQPEAQPTNIHQYKAVLADYEQKINAERRENERLRDLLAQIIAIAEDTLVMAKDRYAETSYARRLEAIEAAKEIHNA